MIDVKEKNVYKSDKVVIERWINDYFFICPFTIFNKNYFDYKKVEKILKKKIKISSKNFYQSFSKKKILYSNLDLVKLSNIFYNNINFVNHLN